MYSTDRPTQDLNYIKQLKKALTLASEAKFDSLIVCGDFNLPHIDWCTGVATNNDSIQNVFTKTVKDNYLWQFVDFPTRINNTLDLLFTNIPDKVTNVHGFVDIIATDHTLISFEVDFKICKKPKVKRSVYNFKNANWSGLKQILTHIPWERGFVADDVNASLSSCCESFISAVISHIRKRISRRVYDPLGLIKNFWLYSNRKTFSERNRVGRRVQKMSQKFILLRRESKILIAKKKSDHTDKMKKSVFENPKRFWSYVKSSTRSSQSPNILRNGLSYTPDSREKANLLNAFFHSVFNPSDIKPPASNPTPSVTANNQLSDIELIEEEVSAVLRKLDPNKASGPDGIPCRLLKEVAQEIAPLCSLFNLSLSPGVIPIEWKFANISLVFKKEDPTLESNYIPSYFSTLCTVQGIRTLCF